MQVKSAMMKAPGSFAVTSNTGHVIRFEAGKEKFVPGVMVAACKKYGAVVTKYFSDTGVTLPGEVKVTSEIQAVAHDPDMDSVEEVTLASLEDNEEVHATESDRYTEKENRVRGIMNTLVMTKDERAFTSDGVPKLVAVNKMLQDFTISAETRNDVWAKMNRLGEVPSDWYANQLDDTE